MTGPVGEAEPAGGPAAVSARVLLVGHEGQENLGLRYLSSALRAAGHEPRIVDLRTGAGALVETAAGWRPDVIGLSLIFQSLLPEYALAVSAARAAGCRAHVTMGGHFASFRHEWLLQEVPGLDSVVRFEGEDVLPELSSRVAAGMDWTGVPGLAWRDPDGRAREADPVARGAGGGALDRLPWPDRTGEGWETAGVRSASVLGSRGCPWGCSFCSIARFYACNGTPGRRLRAPDGVADEVEHLCRDRGVGMVLFQDDDFLAGGTRGVAWAHAVAAELVRRGLHRDVRWRISCRSDEATVENLDALEKSLQKPISRGVRARNPAKSYGPIYPPRTVSGPFGGSYRGVNLRPLAWAGLSLVYLGVEAGDEEDLRHLGKRLSPRAHLAARDALREVGLGYEFGYMLLNPWSTLRSVRANIAFLRDFAGDGGAVAGFCRMLPYAGTPAQARLEAEGRLLGTPAIPDYLFLDPRLDLFYDWLLWAFGERNYSDSGGVNLLRVAAQRARLAHGRSGARYAAAVRHLVAADNLAACDALSSALDHIVARWTPGAAGGAGTGASTLADPALVRLAVRCHEREARLRRRLAVLGVGTARARVRRRP